MITFKNILVGLLILSGSFLNAQESLSLEINNPQPRVGDEVEMTIDFSFFNDFVSQGLGENIDIVTNGYFPILDTSIVSIVSFQTAGTHVLGPFEFEFNGTLYKTDSLIVEVDEKLPFEEGVWLRYVKGPKGKLYLLLEQYISEDSKNAIAPQPSTDPFFPNNEGYVSFKKFQNKGITLAEGLTRWRTRFPDLEQRSVKFEQLNYMFRIYKVELAKRFSRPFEITSELIENLPKNISFTPVIIQRL